MGTLALSLVLLSALLHASWNLLAKRIGSGAPFVWLLFVTTLVLFAPAAIFLMVRDRPQLGLADLAVIAGSGVLHLGYMLALQRGYRVGDLSLVYPLARGTGPMLSVMGAMLIFGERPGPVALAGVAMTVLGAFVLAGGERLLGRLDRPALGYGLLTGLFIASYTLVDAHGVARLQLHPLVLLWGSELLRVALLTPFVLPRFGEVRRIWAEYRLAVVAVAVLSPLAYLLVLVALQLAPVSYVAPAREISILIGAVLGARLLREGEGMRRLAAAAVMVAGVYVLTRPPL